MIGNSWQRIELEVDNQPLWVTVFGYIGLELSTLMKHLAWFSKYTDDLTFN